jgi:hypothetical protein
VPSSRRRGKTPALFYPESTSMPALDGWSVRDHNLFQNVRDGWCPSPLGTGETCNTADPGFVGEPASPIKAESDLDNFNVHLTAGSPAVAAGVAIAGVTTDSTGFARANPPSLGAVQSGAP